MDVSVLSKPAQRSRLSTARTSVLGDGLLERTRSTTLALLGLTAALGLTMVALALNQGWPLIAGAPIPSVESEHRAVDEAVVVTPARPRADRAAFSRHSSQGGRRASAGESRSHLGRAALGGSQAPQATSLVASHPTAAPAAAVPPSETPAAPEPVAQQGAPSPTPTSAAVPAPGPSSSPAAVDAPDSPIPSKAPPAGSEGDEHGHGHAGHGHGRSHSGDDPDSSESSEGPEESPTPTASSPPEADASEGEQPQTPSWSHGGGHGHGHDHW